MSREEKELFILQHFSRQCLIFLEDVLKKRRGRPRGARKPTTSALQVGENIVRKKYSCYICFDKFCTKEELQEHKLSHVDEEDEEKSRESLEFEEKELNEEKSVLTAEQSQKLSRQQSLHPISNNDEDTQDITNPEPTKEQEKEETKKSEKIETSYKCLFCNIYFQNQVDIKNHVHTQYSCKYYCKHCSRQFNTKGGFIVHVLQHGMKQTMKLSYKCDRCPCSFEDCYQLKRHYVSVHNVFTESSTKANDNIPKILKPTFKAIAAHSVVKSNVEANSKLQADPKSLARLNPSNPMTGAIPIFDCDVCYDVFASSKALRRHKALHQELDVKAVSGSSPICIDDDNEIQVIQQDSWLNPHEGVSNFTTSAAVRDSSSQAATNPMATLTPLELGHVLTNLPKSMPLLSADAQESSVLDKSELTAQITQMLGGKLQKKVVSQPRRVYPAIKPVLKTAAPVSQIATSSVSGISTVSTADSNVKYMRVLNSGQQTTLMASGQSYFMINPSDIPVGSIALQGTSSSSTVISSAPSQSVTAPSFSTREANSSASGTSNRNVLLNPNISPAGHASILKSLSGLSGLDPKQTIYVLLPTSEIKKKQEVPALQPLSAAEKRTGKKKNAADQQTNPGTRKSSKQKNDADQQKNTETRKSVKQTLKNNIKTVLFNTSSTIDLSEDLSQETIRLFSEGDSATATESESVVMPVITNVETAEEIQMLDAPDLMYENRNNSDFIMPIITSISTVEEDSINVQEKASKDPGSIYENEFAKFLKNKADSPYIKPRRLKSSLHTSLLEKDLSNDDVQMSPLEAVSDENEADDNVLLNLDDNVPPALAIDVNTSDINVPQIDSEPTISTTTVPQLDIKPKIFVKKLTDLLDISRKSPELSITRPQQKPVNIDSTERCKLCELTFQNWLNYKLHMEKIHGRYACKFFKCQILEGFEELRDHMKATHYCMRCGGEFRSLVSHDKFCSFSSVHCISTVEEPASSNIGTNDALT